MDCKGVKITSTNMDCSLIEGVAFSSFYALKSNLSSKQRNFIQRVSNYLHLLRVESPYNKHKLVS
jgi:hypothetical protein